MNSSFLIKRLKRMSFLEVGYRFFQNFQTKWDSRLYRSISFPTVLPFESKLLFESIDIDSSRITPFADKIVEDVITIFFLKDYKFEQLNFHKDYKSSIGTFQNKYGFEIDYRNGSITGDIKYIWELNRLSFLIPLALAFRATGDEKYLKKCLSFLDQWFDQNPFALGINWASSLELSIRLINWTISWHLISGEISEEFKRKWLDRIYKHCWFISRNLSLFSSANNHLIGEIAGLFIASTALPTTSMSRRWQKKSYNFLLKECLRQNHPDGVNKEQSLYYHHYVVDYLMICGLVGGAYGVEFPISYWGQIEKMLDYIIAMKDVAGNYPQLGDDDGGVAIEFNQKEYGLYKSLLNTGAFIFKRKDLLHDDWKEDLKTKVLLNAAKINIKANIPVEVKNIPFRFDSGGYYILGNDLNTSREQKLIFDCGPLGYLSLAAHGHADALSFFYSAGGYPIFIDPGTYAYHANTKWRDYFRSTLAHNTLSIDNLNQSTIAGNFMWSQKANAHLIEYEELKRVKGWHDGYTRLKDPVTHTRELKYNEEYDCWDLVDEIECKRRHKISLLFHLHPSCSASLKDNTVEIFFPMGLCRLELPRDMLISFHKGEENPPLGWYSGSYDCKEETTSIIVSKHIYGTCQLFTRFKVLFK